jgi:PKD repeat protein
MRQLYLLLTILHALVPSIARTQDLAGFNFTIGPGNTVSFINTSVVSGDGDRKAVWHFGDGTQQLTAALAGTEHQYNNGGEYKVCLKIYKYTAAHDSVVTADICKTIFLQSATDQSCKAGFETAALTDSGLTKSFVAQPWHSSGKRPEQVCWIFGDNSDTCINYDPSSQHNYAVRHNYKESGSYTVCVIIKYQGGCKADFCHQVTAAETITCKTAYRTETANDQPLLKYFIAQPWNSQQKKPVRICWKFGDGKDTCVQYAAASGQHYVVKHIYAHAGRYETCVKVLFEGGCEAQYCRVETVGEPATHPDTCFVHVKEAASALSHTKRKFYADLAPGKVPLKICWRFGDGQDSCVNLSHPPTDKELEMVHAYPAPGRYELCAMVWYDGGCTAQTCRIVEIASAGTDVCGGYMTDSLTALRTVLFRGFSIMNANDHVVGWRWIFGDGSSADGQEVKHEFVKGGTYAVCLFIRTELGCETKICKKLTVHGGDRETPLQLSPNPVTGVLHVVFKSAFTEEITIRIFNASGILARTYTRSAVAGTNTWDLDLGNLPAGLYSVIVQSPRQLASAIVLKQ